MPTPSGNIENPKRNRIRSPLPERIPGWFRLVAPNSGVRGSIRASLGARGRISLTEKGRGLVKLETTPTVSAVDQFGQLLVRSRLLDEADVQGLLRRWRRETPADDDVEHFSQWLVAQDTLTEYQVSLIQRGHVDHCFLDDYRLLDRIGRGRMAGVYKAVHKLGQVVALKVLPPSRASNPQTLARFHREAKLALRLKHPHVVRTFQMADTADVSYIVMEYLDGETLHDVLRRRGTLPVAEGVRLIHQALLGLQHLHEKRLVHRDLKPSNLMLVPPARRSPDTTLRSSVKILDIGLGKDLLEDNTEEVSVSVQLTGENTLLGTPDYLAPEQARNARSVDIRADIYSLGCVLYHVLTGHTVFPDTNVFQLILRHATEEPRSVREWEPSVPEDLEEVLRHMMAKDPEARYESPAQAAEALRPFLPAQELAPAEPAGKTEKFVQWVEKQQNTTATRPRRMAARGPSAFELGGAGPRTDPEEEPVLTPASSVRTTVVELSPEDQTALNPSLRVPRSRWTRRDSLVLSSGAGLGAALVLAIQALLWLLLHKP